MLRTEIFDTPAPGRTPLPPASMPRHGQPVPPMGYVQGDGQDAQRVYQALRSDQHIAQINNQNMQLAALRRFGAELRARQYQGPPEPGSAGR